MKGPFSKGLFLFLDYHQLCSEMKNAIISFINYKILALEIYEH